MSREHRDDRAGASRRAQARAQAPAMRAPLRGALVALLLVGCAASLAPAANAQCGDGPAGFQGWLQRFKVRAAEQGIAPAVIAAALDHVSYDASVIRLDRSQHSFGLSFEAFYARRVDRALLERGRALMRTHRATLERVEKRFGVPGSVLIAIWGLETNYGRDSSGHFSILRSLATLAYDCRRQPFFTAQLLDALRIIERGDLRPAELRGGWAGEIGQMQFLPSVYLKYAVDFDGDGRRDLEHSVPDMLASTANFLLAHGWQARRSWEPGSPNYAALAAWNKAEVYQRTIAVVAEKLREPEGREGAARRASQVRRGIE
jgi:lytic murein transglycosylase